MHAAQLVIGALAIAVIQQQTQQQPVQPPAALSPVSVEHVRNALEKPSTLTIRIPDFYVHIEQRPPMADIFDTPLWQLPPKWSPPRAGFDVASLIMSGVQGIVDARRGHDERKAREEVQQSIAEYCASQPNRAMILMCPGR